MSRSRGSFLSVLAVLALALSAAASAGAEQIAYQCESDLCLVNPDNPSEHSYLVETDNFADNWERSPVWSPRGDLVAYVGLYPSTGNESWDIYTVDPNEAAPREATNVSQSKAFDEEDRPDWSPDGNLLGFTSRPQASNNPLKAEAGVGRADGAAPPVAIGSSSANEGGTQFGPNSSTVAFLREGAIYTAPANGTGTPAPLQIASYGDLWSPDGRYMAGFRFGAYPYGLVITAVGGSGSHELSAPIDLGTTVDWSCDSRRITYVADEEPLDQVRVALADGSGPGVQIPMPVGWIVPHNPVFSSDGTRVAFDARPSTGPGYEQILVAPADGSAAATPITSTSLNSSEPTWKPGPSCGASSATPPATSGAPAAGAPTNTIPATQAPVKLKLGYLKAPLLSPHFMTPVFIDCHAQGGHPTGKVAEICAANASAYARGVAPAGLRPWAKAKGPKKVLFASGKVKVPAGKKKNLKMKITAAGQKLLVPGRTLTVTLKLVTRQGSAKPVTSTKTLKLKVPAAK